MVLIPEKLQSMRGKTERKTEMEQGVGEGEKFEHLLKQRAVIRDGLLNYRREMVQAGWG